MDGPEPIPALGIGGGQRTPLDQRYSRTPPPPWSQASQLRPRPRDGVYQSARPEQDRAQIVEGAVIQHQRAFRRWIGWLIVGSLVGQVPFEVTTGAPTARVTDKVGSVRSTRFVIARAGQTECPGEVRHRVQRPPPFSCPAVHGVLPVAGQTLQIGVLLGGAEHERFPEEPVEVHSTATVDDPRGRQRERRKEVLRLRSRRWSVRVARIDVRSIVLQE